MFTRRTNIPWIIAGMAVMVLLLVGVATAATAGGTGPDDAMRPDGQWKTLTTGQQHWYMFRFDYDSARANEPVEIRIYSEPSDAAVLTVHNEQQAELWRQDGKKEHFGCCTLFNEDKNDDGKPDFALWSGALGASGKYYIIVEPAKNVTAPVQYRFEITGKGISYPSTTTPVTVAPVVVPPAKLTEKGMGSLVGTGPDFAMSPTDEWRELKVGEYQWFKFHFGYDKARANKNIEVQLYSEPNQGAILTVRNEAQADLWRRDGKHEWFGCAMPFDRDRNSDGNPDFGLWSGQLAISGDYYLVVEHDKQIKEPVYYRMVIRGEGVSYPTVTVPVVKEAPVVVPVVVTQPVVDEQMALMGTGPDFAMKPTAEWHTINSGETQWYAFRFAYDEKRANEPIEIRIYSEPFDSAVLTVHNEQQADLWRRDGKLEHFGCCTLFEQDKNNDGKPDFALWSGKLSVSGTYYIVVERAPNITGPVRYQFVLSGDGVSY